MFAPASSMSSLPSMLAPPSGNAAWFTFIVESVPDLPLGVYAFSGTEAMNSPFEFTIELVSRSAALGLTKFLGKEALLTIHDKSGKRIVHGIIREFEQGHTANAFTFYRARLVPRLHFLGQIRDHHIFQNLTVPEIIEKLLVKNGFTEESFKLELNETYPKREYCTQYGESTLHFLSRLCEEECLQYSFSHSEVGHVLHFTDTAGGSPIAGNPLVRFCPTAGGAAADMAVVSSVRLRHRINSDSATYRDWNFTTPALDLLHNEREMDWPKAPTPISMHLEQYQFPHIYQTKDEAERYAKLQLQRQLVFRQWIECQTDVSRHMPGFTFTLYEHPRPDVNREWWIFSVTQQGQQPQVLEHEAPDGRGMTYQAQVTAIPSDTRFAPELAHHKARIEGVQSAIVTGPSGEEIYPDEFGRVKVQFFWDRIGEWNEKTTCWIRVAQGWAGSQYGTIAIPRIGHEVLVSFMEGDPDRPIITGRAYHALNKVPYELPAHKTRTVFKSMSTPGKDGEARGFNELRIEDKKGQEEIYVHAEKDVNTFTKNDWKNHILHDRHETVDNYTYAHTKGETHETFQEHRKTELHANDNLTIHGTAHTEIDEKWLATVGDEVHIKAGAKVVIDGGTDLTIKAGGQWIRLDPSGIRTSSIMNIGSGSAGEGTDAAPEKPENANGTESGRKIKAKQFTFDAEIIEAMEKAMLDAQTNAQPVAEQCSLEVPKVPADSPNDGSMNKKSGEAYA